MGADEAHAAGEQNVHVGVLCVVSGIASGATLWSSGIVMPCEGGQQRLQLASAGTSETMACAL